MSKAFYLRCNTLHALPICALNIQRIQVGNGQHVGVLFVILVIVDVFEQVYAFFPKEKVEIKPKEQKLVIVEEPFVVLCKSVWASEHFLC